MNATDVMGIIKALYLGKKLLTPDAKMEMELMQKLWDKDDKKLHAHVDTCPKLQAMELCTECNDVAMKTRNNSLLVMLQEEIKVQSTKSIREMFTDEQIIEAALAEWLSDPSRPVVDRGCAGDTYHESVHALVLGDTGWLGDVKVTHNSGGLFAEFNHFNHSTY